jgi:hypothetical protein
MYSTNNYNRVFNIDNCNIVDFKTISQAIGKNEMTNNIGSDFLQNKVYTNKHAIFTHLNDKTRETEAVCKSYKTLSNYTKAFESEPKILPNFWAKPVNSTPANDIIFKNNSDLFGIRIPTVEDSPFITFGSGSPSYFNSDVSIFSDGNGYHLNDSLSSFSGMSKACQLTSHTSQKSIGVASKEDSNSLEMKPFAKPILKVKRYKWDNKSSGLVLENSDHNVVNSIQGISCLF